MATVLLVVHIMVAVAMIVIILLQRSEGGALGMGGGGNFMSGRGAANLLTRTTSILAAMFFTLSLALGIVEHKPKQGSAVDGGAPANVRVNAPAAPAGTTATSQPQVPLNSEPAPSSLPDIKLRRPGGTSNAPAQQKPIAPAQPQIPQSQ